MGQGVDLGRMLQFEICQEGEPRVDRELRRTAGHDAAPGLPDLVTCLQASSKFSKPGYLLLHA